MLFDVRHPISSNFVKTIQQQRDSINVFCFILRCQMFVVLLSQNYVFLIG